MRNTRLHIRLALALPLMMAAGCQVDDLTPKAEKPLPQKILASMKAKGMNKSSPIMLRIFKEEGLLEVWKQKDTGRYDLVRSYDICKWSGRLGPKFMENDRQAPEGFYTVRPAQMNPKSSYHLSFNIGFPNAYDSAHGRSGAHLMVHGACSSSGCYSMSDEQVEEIFAFARDSFRGGQTAFQIQALPFRMTPQNMARYKGDPNFAFWENLKEGYDHFEIAKVPPKVDVCEKRYVFNVEAPEGYGFSPSGACPPMAQPASLKTAYESHKAKHADTFAKVAAKGNLAPRKPSIKGPQEAAVIAAWQKRRVRGEAVGNNAPYLPDTAIAAAPPQPDQSAVASIEPRQQEEPAPQMPAASEMAMTAAPATAPVTAQPETRTAAAPAKPVAADTQASAEFPPAPPAPDASQPAQTVAAPAPAPVAESSQTLAVKKPWWKMFGN